MIGAGALVGQYRIVGTIGSGGMGTVYLGEHTLLGRRAAIKLLHAEVSSQREMVERFFNEGRATAAIHHPGIVQIFDFGFADDGAYIVMELLEGTSLGTRLERTGRLGVPEALRAIRQVTSAMAAAHAAGILHRDLKPDNIFLVTDADAPGGVRAKVLDFGIAKLGDARDTITRSGVLTQTGAILGTPRYMSPEQLRGGELDARSDIYALGTVMFEMLTGAPVFAADSVADLTVSHLTEAPDRPSRLCPDVPDELDAIVLRCLEKDPARRFASMAELGEAVDRVMPGDPMVSSPWSSAPRPNATMVGQGVRHTLADGIAGVARGLHAVSERLGLARPPQPPPPVTSTPRIASGSTPPRLELAEVFEAAVPPAFRDLLPYAVEFFRELFGTARRQGPHLIELGAPELRDLESRAHHVVFLGNLEQPHDRSPAQIGTAVFRAQIDPFTRQLEALAVPAGSVLIAVLAAPQLGQGARETIFALRKERNLFVVPIAAAEIRRACEVGNARDVIVSRIADLHAVSDPFAASEGTTDPTCWIGFSAGVADLVKHIIAGGKIVSVAGPPGSGKTSTVAMAEYGCDTSHVAREFVRFACGDASSRDPARLLQDMTARIERLQAARSGGEVAPAAPPPVVELPNLRATVLALGARRAEPSAPTVSGLLRVPRRETGLAKRHQLVLVLEDADWLIRMGSSAEPDELRRAAARELWRGLNDLCAAGKHTVIVTSVRDFQATEQVPLERPVDVVRVPMHALTRNESEQLVRSIGELVGFQPTRRAFAALARASGGNVYALRLLCSDVIRSARERPGYSPLAALRVTARMVDDAADRIAATGSSFRSHVALWLDPIERTVVQHVARRRPRTPRQVRVALQDSATPAEVAKALDALELMGLVEHRAGRHRVHVPLFERWINVHLDDPASVASATRQRRVSRLAIGFTCTALLFGGYWTWLRSTRSAPTRVIGACTYQLDHPDRIGVDEALVVRVNQDCTAAAPHKLAVEAVLSALTPAVTPLECGPAAGACAMAAALVAGNQAHDRYLVRLRVDGAPILSATIAKDRFATLRGIGERSVPAISFLPALFALIFSFHKEARRFVGQLFGSREAS